mgnify:CR=1 FL=1
MTETVTIVPAEGRRVRHPITSELLGAEPVALARDAWLTRRLDEGDAIVVPEGTPTKVVADAPAEPAPGAADASEDTARPARRTR